MNLGMILNAPFPPDMRVKKETEALTRAGFKIHLLCLRKSGEKYQENLNGVSITRIDAGKNNLQLALRDMLMSLTFRHPEFARAMKRWVKENEISVVHVHDLPLVGTALALRRQLGIKVIADLHENYPEALRTWFAWKKGFVVKIKNRLFMNPGRWTSHERIAVLNSDFVIAVVEEMKERLIERYGADPAKIIVVSNTEDKAFINQPLDDTVYQQFGNKFKVVYSGAIGPHRGVDTAIEGMTFLKSYPEIVLLVIGTGSKDVMQHLSNRVASLQLENQVHFLGYQPFQKFFSFMRFADVNTIPHKSNEHTDNTVPHKLFQSMMTGRPVLVSSSDPLKRIVTNTGAGLVFQANDPRDFADKVRSLYDDRNLANRLGENGRKATIDGDLNWDYEQNRLADFYRNLFYTPSEKQS